MENKMMIPNLATQREFAALPCVTQAYPTAPVAATPVRDIAWAGVSGTDAKGLRPTTGMRFVGDVHTPGSQTWSPPI